MKVEPGMRPRTVRGERRSGELELVVKTEHDPLTLQEEVTGDFTPVLQK